MLVGPFELNPAITSSLRVNVPCVLEAPTVSTHGAFDGRGDAAVLHLAERVLAEVAGRRRRRRCRVDERLGRERQRVGPVGLADPRAHRQVDHADVVGLVVGGDPVERRDDVADRADAVRCRAPSAKRSTPRARCRPSAPCESWPLPAMMPETWVPWPLSSYGCARAVDEVHELGDALVAVGNDVETLPLRQVVVPARRSPSRSPRRRCPALVAERLTRRTAAPTVTDVR